jgi:hypothetical protein
MWDDFEPGLLKHLDQVKADLAKAGLPGLQEITK